MAIGSTIEMEREWVKEVKEFDESKMGVQGLLDSGVTTIPRIFIHPPENLSDLQPSSTHFEIPVIDLSITNRSKVIDQIKESFSTWGFFQVINHGIPMQDIEDTIKAFKSFHEQPKEIKSAYVWDQKVSYYSNFNIMWSKAVNWKDSLRVFTSPNPPKLETIPSVCRKEVMQWDEYMKGLCETLMELMCEGLGVNKNRLKELSCLGMRKFVCHYYPYCPQPDLTLGLPTHTDRGVLTLLLQNEVSGLQIKYVLESLSVFRNTCECVQSGGDEPYYGDEWVEVKPIHGAIIVNVGDLLQIFTNDQFKSVEHRVLSNACKESRVSAAVIYNPGKRGESDIYGPLTELLSPENPALYRNFTIPEILKQGLTDDSSSKAIVDLFRLNCNDND